MRYAHQTKTVPIRELKEVYRSGNEHHASTTYAVRACFEAARRKDCVELLSDRPAEPQRVS